MGVCVAPESGNVMEVKSCPGFEGFEKRLEVEFHPAPLFSDPAGRGLRALARAELDVMLDAAKCTIVAQLCNEEFDSYVLSESSLFVYPLKIVLKTCGTTQILKAIPPLLEFAAGLSLKLRRCKYTRGTFMFPAAQPYPHGSFSEEVGYLEQYFGDLGSGGKAYVMGNMAKFPNWHIYSASDENDSSDERTYTLEMCMTKLDKEKASQFFNVDGKKSGADMTEAAGINELLPNSKICDFSFEPCGYSMNSIEGAAHSTIHVTPEDGFSFASFETMGYGPREVDLVRLVENVTSIFRPACFSMCLYATGSAGGGSCPGSWEKSICPSGYVCDGTSRQELPCGSVAVFHTFKDSRFGAVAAVHALPLFQLPEQVLCEDEYVPGKSLVSKKDPKYSSSCGKNSLWNLNGVVGGEMAEVFTQFDAAVIGSTLKDTDSFIRKKVNDSELESAFYVMDLGSVLRQWKLWVTALPRVKPFYAVKCNPDAALLALLHKLGAGFDVASKSELKAVTDIGAVPENIIFANPCKLPTHITEAGKHGVLRTTFDSESELYKLKKFLPHAEVVLRIRADDPTARCQLGTKYGAELEECEQLLTVAKQLSLKVVGVAFHVGSGASDASAFAYGIECAKYVFGVAEAMGLNDMKILDIGGGFVSNASAGVNFATAASTINKALDKCFPVSMGVTVIAEPGRFFAEDAFTLATYVFGCRMRKKGGTKQAEYWVNDGIYGSMNCLLYDHAVLSVRALSQDDDAEEEWRDRNVYQSTIFGPTCDGLDTVMRDIYLPELQCGDWLLWPRMGAYTKAAGSNFNGFNVKDIPTSYVYTCREKDYSCFDHDFLVTDGSESSEEYSIFSFGKYSSSSSSDDEQ
ncbi:S-adenosylmethionine decarboxylase [Marchantia polymorpha subsp. ruderalis]|nr:hypothetical protein MARPO_0001s0543 [Marchantia polymorpha]BBM99564.1 hypothetical protein Mp_1g22070 [Marchantia polymorpha subsp. ruderalis]|eukprot:PTQ50650.1 hypothetical protein MARPO_0001s0543 [Marchantia polymorpha]